VPRPCPRQPRGHLTSRSEHGGRAIRRDLLPLVREELSGRYEVEDQIARGGAARVFRARDREGRLVALKILHPELIVTVTAQRFLREIALLAKLDHPKVARLHDYGETDHFVYFVMAFAEGPTLREHLNEVRQAAIERTRSIARDLLDALAYAHEHGIVHRDVKPENVVLASEGALLLDFGIARAIARAGTDRLTRSGFAIGTSTYMSPEQASGEEDLDNRSDLYSLGCVLFECVAGRPPFTAAREEAILAMHVKEDAPDVRSLREDVPEWLAAVIGRALRRPRAERWASAREMLEAIP